MKCYRSDKIIDIDAFLKKIAVRERWERIPFGEYEGFTIPELVFENPSYFYWALSIDAFEDMLKLEANMVEGRLRHIRLPKAMRGTSSFVMMVKNRMFSDFKIVEKQNLKSQIAHNVIVSRHLDFSVVSRPDFGTNRAREKMLARMKQYFFSGEPGGFRRKAVQAFLGNPANFGGRCEMRHLPGVPRWNDAEILEETLRQENKRNGLVDDE